MFSDMRVVLGSKSSNKSDESIAASTATTQTTATKPGLSSSLLPEGDGRNGGGGK